MSVPRACCAALLLGFSVAAAHALDAIRITSTRAIEIAPRTNTSHALRLHLYTFQDTHWTGDEALGAATAAAKLLEQCSVAVLTMVLSEIDAPERYRYYSTPVSRELARILEPPKPAVFFVEDTLNRPAFDAEAIGRANAGSRPELADTVWVAYGAADLPLALAHELVHMLSDSGAHSSEAGNLMLPRTRTDNVQLTTAQCARLRLQGQANGLLQAR